MADAGTVTASDETYGTVKKIVWNWTSSAGGAADLQTPDAFSGAIARLVTVPGLGGSQPTSYGVVVNDEDGNDVLMGAGAGRSISATEQVNATSLGIVANDKLYLHITGAGATKSGTVYLYVR